ncbi:hypothetical protein BaRGS_00013007, partial [Batillaria attramentaria]
MSTVSGAAFNSVVEYIVLKSVFVYWTEEGRPATLNSENYQTHLKLRPTSFAAGLACRAGPANWTNRDGGVIYCGTDVIYVTLGGVNGLRLVLERGYRRKAMAGRHIAITTWLEALGLQAYLPLFSSYGGVEDLLYASEGEIRDLGLKNGAHRAKIVSSLRILREKYEK